ncbi:MAG TPA: hypothetical protein VNZ26_11550 [Vicinamibacterales bacterium]|nr:hypothetical protein [Vicinamibacterales bacterium]
MNAYTRGVIWFNRFVLVAAISVMSRIALRNLGDPIAATLPLGIALDSPSAVTVGQSLRPSCAHGRQQHKSLLDDRSRLD